MSALRIRFITRGFLTLIFFPTCLPVFAEEPIKVGVLVSLTGNWSEMGENVRRGISLANEEIKKKGIISRTLEFDFQDTEEEVSGLKVVTAYRNLRGKGVGLFIGPTGVPGEQAIVPIAKNDDVVIISSLTGPQIQNYSDKFFNSAGTNEQTTRAVAKLAFQKGARRCAIFGSLQPWESDQARFFKEEFESLGGVITANVSPQPTERDLKAEALTIIRAKPDAVFFAVLNQVSLAAQELSKLGYKGQLYSSLLDPAHIANANGTLEGTLVFQFVAPSNEFKAKLQSSFSMQPAFPIDFTYDAVLALAEAIKVSGSSDPKLVKAALHSVRFIGSAGKETGLGKSGLIEREIELVSVKGGELLPVK